MKGIWTILSVLAVSNLLPLAMQEPAAPPVPPAVHLIMELPEPDREQIRLLDHGTVLTLTMEDYLTGVVLAEMPASFAPEALKAQAVAARTFACRHMEHSRHAEAALCSDSTCCQAWCSEAQLEQKLGTGWKQYEAKVRSAVQETAGQVLTYEGELIDAVYFSCSGGSTEDAVAVWGSQVPYLRSVPSDGEENSRKFRSEVRVPAEKFRTILRAENKEVKLEGPPDQWIGPMTPTAGGGVDRLILGGQSFAGTRLRQLFGLNSAKFTLRAEDNDLVFSVLGAGHRVGMSQYGANAMAEAGKTCEEILLHYYTGAQLTTKIP